MQYRTYTFRAYPNKAQEKLIHLTFRMCRLMYNTLLRIVFDNYALFCKENEKCLNSNKIFNTEIFSKEHKLPKISKLKKSHYAYSKVDSLAICAEYNNLVRGMEMFYSGNCKKPKFKRRNDKNSYTTSMVNNNIRIDGKKIRLPKVGFVKIRGMRNIPSHFKIKRAVVFENKTGKFFISLVFEFNDNNILNKKTSTKVVGLDFKIGDIFVSSDKLIPKFNIKYYSILNKIPKVQKNINSKKKFSKNYWKSINKLRNIHRKAVNIRRNLQNKISTFLCKKYDYIIIEDLSIKEIVYKLGTRKKCI